jgi:hypothetical protein
MTTVRLPWESAAVLTLAASLKSGALGVAVRASFVRSDLSDAAIDLDSLVGLAV